MKKIAFSILSLLIVTVLNMQAQPGAKGMFNTAVDQINCETIRFIHNEVGRDKVANTMNCNSYAGIIATIPADESKTTLRLAKDIEAFKDKFSEKSPLPAQLDKVVLFADSKIRLKKRKGDVDAFLLKLNKIKTDAVLNLKALQNENTVANAETNASASDNVGDEENAVVAATTDTDQNGENQSKSQLPGYFAMVLGVVAILISVMSYLRKNKTKSQPSFDNKNEEKLWRRNELESRWETRFTELEENYKSEIAELKQEIKLLSEQVTAQLEKSTVSNAVDEEDTVIYDESNLGKTDFSDLENPATDDSDEDEYLDIKVVNKLKSESANLDWEQALKDEKEMDSFDNQDEEPELNNDLEIDIPNEEEAIEEETTFTLETKESVDSNASLSEVQAENLEESKEYSDSNEQVLAVSEPEPVFSSDDDNAYLGNAAQARTVYVLEPEMYENEIEESGGVGLPAYKYLGIPNEDGTFNTEDFTESPNEDSVYEVELYEEVPNKAFFSVLHFPDTIEKVIHNAEKYLKPCCEYNDSPEGKDTIFLIEEGQLHFKEDKWIIAKKSKIKFG